MNISSHRGQSSSYGSVEGEFLPSRGGRNHERSGGLLRWVGIAAVAGLALGAMMAARSDGSQQNGVKTMNLAELTGGTRVTNVDVLGESSQEPLSFTALNFYQERDGKPGQDYPWLKDMKLLEPYRDTTLAVTNPREGFDYQWEIRADGDLITSATGASTVVIVTKLEENVVTLQEVNESGQVVRSLQETVMVKYVRREIRTLTEEDKEELLDTMHVLWEERVMGGNGKEKYGDGYSDIWAINRLHFKAATIDSCDHFHDGLGFLVSHSLLSNTFEHSLQVVNPKVTLPYWDFTIEESSSADPTYDPTEPSTRSPLLQPDYFGAYDPDDHIVKSGRWAYTKIPSVLPNNPGSLNTDVYGRLRSPWNTNDRPYLTRGMGEMCQIEFDQDIAWPTCQKHYDLVAGYDNFYEWVWESLGNPHAPIHFWLGGNIDCRNTFKRIADVVGSDVAESLVHLANAHRKELYCDGIWSCEGIADTSKTTYELAGDGTCGCLGYDLDWGHDYKFIMEHLDFGEFLLRDFDEKTQRDVIKAICGGVLNYGEHGQSSSPLDPSFWPTHPTMERLWQYSVLTESVKDFNWPDKDVTVTLPDGTTISEVTSSYYEQCFGHRGFDIFPFGLLEDDIDDFEVWTGVVGTGNGNTLTNREVLAMFDPRENNMQYIYDTFKWKHCDADGVFFDDAWGDTTAVKESVDHRFFERQKPLSAVYINLKRKMADLMEEEADL